MNALVRAGAWLCLFGGVVFLVASAGCSESGYKVAKVKGKVTYEGQPVKGGSITFRPVSVAGAEAGMMGKPASAEVLDDGTFVLSTYGEQDGAVIGKHQVLFTPISKGAESYDDEPEPSPYIGLVPKMAEVEIKAGSNDIEIELIKSEG